MITVKIPVRLIGWILILVSCGSIGGIILSIIGGLLISKGRKNNNAKRGECDC